MQAVIIHVDHDNLGRRIELRREQGGEPDGAGTDNGDGRTRLHLAVEHAAFKAGGKDVTQHDERIFVRACGNVIETGIGEGNADKFCLGAVNLVAENPAAIDAMRIHAAAAIVAFSARRDARHDYAIADVKCGDCPADLIDYADALMTQDAAGRASRHVAFKNVQVGAADGRLDYFDNGIGRRGDVWLRTIFNGLLTRSLIDECLHGGLLGCGILRSSASFPGAHSMRKLLISVHRFEHERNPLTTADAQGHDTALDAVPLHRMKETGGQHRAGRADRMTMRDSTTFDVHDILI